MIEFTITKLPIGDIFHLGTHYLCLSQYGPQYLWKYPPSLGCNLWILLQLCQLPTLYFRHFFAPPSSYCGVCPCVHTRHNVCIGRESDQKKFTTSVLPALALHTHVTVAALHTHVTALHTNVTVAALHTNVTVVPPIARSPCQCSNPTQPCCGPGHPYFGHHVTLAALNTQVNGRREIGPFLLLLIVRLSRLIQRRWKFVRVI